MIVTQTNRNSLIEKEKSLMKEPKKERRTKRIRNKVYMRSIYAIIWKIKN